MQSSFLMKNKVYRDEIEFSEESSNSEASETGSDPGEPETLANLTYMVDGKDFVIGDRYLEMVDFEIEEVRDHANSMWEETVYQWLARAADEGKLDKDKVKKRKEQSRMYAAIFEICRADPKKRDREYINQMTLGNWAWKLALEQLIGCILDTVKAKKSLEKITNLLEKQHVLLSEDIEKKIKDSEEKDSTGCTNEAVEWMRRINKDSAMQLQTRVLLKRLESKK